MTNPYRSEPPRTVRVRCPNCGEAWDAHHVEPKPTTFLDAARRIVRVEQTFLIECPCSFGDELRDGRVARRPPTGVLLESLRFPKVGP